MDVADFIEKYLNIRLLPYQKLQIRTMVGNQDKRKVESMIEILKRGTRKQCVCENCGAELSYEEKDVKRGRVHFLDKMTFLPLYPPEYIRCPQCKHKVLIEGVKND